MTMHKFLNHCKGVSVNWGGRGGMGGRVKGFGADTIVGGAFDPLSDLPQFADTPLKFSVPRACFCMT